MLAYTQTYTQILARMDKKIINNQIKNCLNGSKVNLPGLYFLLKKKLADLKKEYQPNISDLDLPDDDIQESLKHKIAYTENDLEILQKCMAKALKFDNKIPAVPVEPEMMNPFGDEFKQLIEFQPDYTFTDYKDFLCIVLENIYPDAVNAQFVKNWLFKSGGNAADAFGLFERCIDILKFDDNTKTGKLKEELFLLKAEHRASPASFEVLFELGNVFLPPPPDYIEITTTVDAKKILEYFSLFYSELNEDGQPLLTKEEVYTVLRYGLSYPTGNNEFKLRIRCNKLIVIRAIFHKISVRCGVNTQDMAQFMKSWFINFNKTTAQSIRSHMTDSKALNNTPFLKYFP